MKITAIIATRGRPQKALGAVEALKMTASWANELEVVVACDDDDPADSAGFFRAYSGVVVDVAPRPAGVGHCWNRVARKTDADLMLAVPDDGVMLTPRWDAIALDLFAAGPWPHPDLAIAAIQDTNSPGQATLFAFNPGWVRHFGLFDTRYPFWFADTAIQELWTFVAGTPFRFLPVTMALPAEVYNPRLRDMGLWWTLFASSRQERLQLAAKVRSELGLPRPPDLDAIVAAHQARDRQGYPDSLDIVAHIPERRRPDAAYVNARTAALEYLQQHDGARHLTGERTAYQFALDTMEAE